MLQKATGNGHSWWWASHVRTKQSKWLQQNLQDMDAKVEDVLNLIQNDGDSFARRAEMYYKHRPDIISFIEETLRAYRSLAERYDKLSTALQKANTTIASVCPEKVDYNLDDDDFNEPKISDSPKTPKLVRLNQTKNPKPVNKDVNRVLEHASEMIEATKTNEENSPKSGLTKDDAVEEIDNLQKEIEEMERMKDWMKNYYENSLAEYWDAETRIIESQQRICSLEEEFEIGKKIEEDGEGALMAEAALKSCEETLAILQDKQRKLGYDVKSEHQRFDQALQTLQSLKQKYNSDLDLDLEHEQEIGSLSNQNQHESLNVNAVLKNPQKMSELADTIDTLVNMAITLETSISSQTLLTDMLRKQADDLESEIRKTEVDLQSRSQKIENDLQTQYQKMEDDLKAQVQKMEDDLKARMQKMEADLQIGRENEHVCICNEIKPEEKRIEIEEKPIEIKSEEKAIDVSWQAMLLNGVEDKDKIILEEYITILRHYKDTKKKLGEEQKKNHGLKRKLKLVQETFGDDKIVIPYEDDNDVIDEAQRFSAIDSVLDENLNFWLKFSTAFHQVHNFKSQIEDLNDGLKKVEVRSDVKPIYKHLKDINGKLTIWLDESTVLKEELNTRYSYLSKIEEGIKFSTHNEAVKLQGEIMNMKQEHDKVSKELEANLDNVVAIKLELEKTLERVEREFGGQRKGKSSRTIIPLKAFLFGVKSKQKSSIFSCLSCPKKSRSKKSGCMSI